MKRNVILVAVLVALIGIYWLVKSQKSAVVSVDRPFVEVDSAKVTVLRVVSPDETVELTKEGDKWRLTKPVSYPAAANQAEIAIGKFREMKRLSLITERSERFADFQVDDAQATKVSVTQGNKTQTILLGKAGPTFQTQYARLEGSNEVWEIAGNHTGVFRKKSRDWRDKTITDLQMEDIRKVTLEYPGEVVSVTLEDTVWKVSSPKAKFDGDKSQVERLTRLLAKFSCTDFADTLSPTAFDHAECRIFTELTNGEPFELRFIKADGEGTKYFVRKSGAASDFVIQKATANNLMKKADDFKSKQEDSPAKRVANS